MDYLEGRSEARRIMLFDVCGTLFYSNTTFDFLAFYHRHSILKERKMKRLRSLFAKIFFKIFFKISGYDLLRHLAVSTLKGEKEDDIRRGVKLFVDNLLEKHGVHSIIAMLRTAQEQGVKVGLISASLDVIIEEIAVRFGIQHWHATQLTFDQGICTGKMEDDLYGHKNTLVKDYVSKYNEVIFITDNFNDLNVQGLVNDFRAVCYSKDRSFWEKRLTNKIIYEK